MDNELSLGFLFGLIAGGLAVCLFSLSNKDYINKEEWIYAETLCKENRGLQEVGNAGARYTAFCVNSAEFNFTTSDMRK